MAEPFGELKRAPVREHWKHEEHDFTPWLARPENIARLGAAVGLDLEVEEVEKACGPYWADILARESGSDRYVVIENQFGKTNHDHLGKLLTYAAALGAGAVIWVSEQFTDEHQKALDWLNDHTTRGVSFFGVKLELWQIDGSRPAVRFDVVSRPSDAVRAATARKVAAGGAGGVLSDMKSRQFEFWTLVRDRLLAEKVVPSAQTPRPDHWFNVALGRSGVFLSCVVNTAERQLSLRVYLHNRIAAAALAHLSAERAQIEAELGATLDWNPYPDNRDKIIVLAREADLERRDLWHEYVEWLVGKVRRFREVFGPRVRAMTFTEASPSPDPT